MEYLSANIEDGARHLETTLSNGTVDVPVLPETAQRVMALTQDADSDAAQLAGIIQSDPTMGGHVMRIANSAAYTPNSNLVSIQQAVARLGMVEISNIALSTSMNSKMFNAPGYEAIIAAIWQHALATALWAKEVARAMRSNVEAAFLCGLLHSIGKPVMLQTIAECDLPAVLTEAELAQLYAEFESPYAQAVAKEWELPAIVTEAIGFYKDYSAAPTSPELTATVAFGSQLATWMLSPATADKGILLSSPTLELINLYPDEVSALIDKDATIKSAMETLSL